MQIIKYFYRKIVDGFPVERKQVSRDPFSEFMNVSDPFFNVHGEISEDYLSSARNMMERMDRMFDRTPFSIGFEPFDDILSPMAITNETRKQSDALSLSMTESQKPKQSTKSDTKVAEHPTYIKAVSSMSIRDGKGNIVSESKGFERNSKGRDKRAYQRRVNDQVHSLYHTLRHLCHPSYFVMDTMTDLVSSEGKTS